MEIADWLENDEKQLKSSRVDNSSVRGFHPAETGTIRFSQWQGSWGAFYLILELPFFGPKQTRYTFFWPLHTNSLSAYCVTYMLRLRRDRPRPPAEISNPGNRQRRYGVLQQGSYHNMHEARER